VDNLLDDSANVTGTLGEVEGAQLGSTLAQTSVRLEDSSGTLTLSTNDTTHFTIVWVDLKVDRLDVGFWLAEGVCVEKVLVDQRFSMGSFVVGLPDP